MKKTDKDYGTDEKEGKKHLYAHDYMLWLKNHQRI